MKHLITIDSDIEFALIGPIQHKDGILVQSKNISRDLIGVAYLTYRQDEINEKIIGLTSTICIWSDGFNFNGKKSNLLFCFKAKNEKRDVVLVEWGKSKVIKNKLNAFIEDVHTELNGIIANSSSMHEVYFNNFTRAINWHISPLLLQCRHPNFNFTLK